MPEPKEDPIAALPRATLELYRDALREVRFPDLDFDSLSQTAAELRAAQLEVECIEAALTSAREAVRERAEQLSAESERALSYAAIFATGKPELMQRVAEIEALASGGVMPPKPAGKKRGRPRKESAGAELFTTAADSALEADEAAA
jgi:hypothetical protein